MYRVKKANFCNRYKVQVHLFWCFWVGVSGGNYQSKDIAETVAMQLSNTKLTDKE